MKEQKDIKQDFDRWLLDQWKEESFVPNAHDRRNFRKKLRFRKFRRKLSVGLTVACILMLLILVVKHYASKEKGRTTTEIKHTSSQGKQVAFQEKSPTTKLKATSFFLPSIHSTQEMLIYTMDKEGMLVIPAEEQIVFKMDTIDRSTLGKVDLDTVMKNLGIFYVQSSTSNEGLDFAGITSSHELILATVIYGTYALPRTPDTMSTDGLFRPVGMAGNQCVQYIFLDARPLIFNEAIYRQVVAMNILPRVAYYMRNTTPGWSNPVDNNMRFDVPQVRSIAQRNQDQNMRHINRQANSENQSSPVLTNRPSIMRQGVRVYQKAKIGWYIGDNFLIKSQGEKVLVVSCDAERVSLVKQNGMIEASHSIRIQEPRYFSQKARYPFYDEASRRLFLIVETNFSYLWFEVNPLTGDARYIFKTETIWNNPNWRIENGQLIYEFKGKKMMQSLN